MADLAACVSRLSTIAAAVLRASTNHSHPAAIDALEDTVDANNAASIPWADPLGLRCPSPPDLPKLSAATKLSEAAAAVLAYGDRLPWKEPKDLSDSYSSWATGALRSIMLTGNCKNYGALLQSDDSYSGIWLLAPNTKYPCHAHESAETFIVLSGAGATWSLDGRASGPWTAADGEVIEISPCTPHSVETGPMPLLVWYVWTGNLRGRYWFCQHAPHEEAAKYSDVRSASGCAVQISTLRVGWVRSASGWEHAFRQPAPSM